MSGNSAQRPMTIEDALMQRVPKDQAVSPDGMQVAFSLGWASKTGRHAVADLWLAALDGSSLRRLTSGDSNDIEPRWSPDGSAIAFISDRARRGKEAAEDADEHPTGDVYLLPAQGGEAVRISAGDAGLADPQWSPDGTKISVKLHDDDSEEQKQRKKDLDDTFVHQEDEKFDRLAILDVPANIFAGDFTPGEPKVIISGDHNLWEHVWSPDGARIAVTLTPHPGWDYAFSSLRAAIVPAGGGELTRVGGESGHYRTAGSLCWSPDGKQLAFLGAFDLKKDAGEAVYIADASNPAEPQSIFNDDEGTPLAITWPVNDRLLMLRLKSVYATLYWLPASGGNPEPALKGNLAERGTIRQNDSAAGIGRWLSSDGKQVAVVWSDATHPDELYAGQLGGEPGGMLQQITHFNDELAGRAFGRTEVVRWKADDGMEIEGLLVYPVGYEEGKRYPTILHIHGGPSWAWDDHLYANWHDWGQWLAGNGYAVLMPNPRGSTGRGTSFQIANYNDWMGSDYRDSQLGLDMLIERGIADPERLGIGGWSYGGLTTSWVVTQTNRFKGAIVGAGVTNRTSMQGTSDIIQWAASWYVAEFAEDPDAYWHRTPIRYIGQVTTPSLVLHGGNDLRVPLSQGWEFYNALKTTGVPTKMVIYPREPHTIHERHHQRDLLERVLAWFDEYVKGA